MSPAKVRSAAPAIPAMRSITSQLNCAGAADALASYREAFGAEEVSRPPMPDGKIMPATLLRLGDSTLMPCDEVPPGGHVRARHAEAPGPAGAMMTAEFRVLGREFVALNFESVYKLSIPTPTAFLPCPTHTPQRLRPSCCSSAMPGLSPTPT